MNNEYWISNTSCYTKVQKAQILCSWDFVRKVQYKVMSPWNIFSLCPTKLILQQKHWFHHFSLSFQFECWSSKMLIKISYSMLLISTFVQISKETLANFNISNWRFFHIQILNHESFYQMLLNIPDFQSYYCTNVKRKKYRQT